MIRYGLILLSICLVASLVLSVTYKFTHSRIEAQQVLEEKGALDEIFPEATDFKVMTLGEENYYLAKKDNRDLGYIIKAETKGYGGSINMLVGFDSKGEIKGIEILSHQETPGLGAKIIEIKAGEESPWFLKQFEGKSAKDIELKSDIQAITGATISSKAVFEGVKKAIVDFVLKLKDSRY